MVCMNGRACTTHLPHNMIYHPILGNKKGTHIHTTRTYISIPNLSISQATLPAYVSADRATHPPTLPYPFISVFSLFLQRSLSHSRPRPRVCSNYTAPLLPSGSRSQ